MLLLLCCNWLCPIHWSQVLSWEWRCSWSSTDRWCSSYTWVINNYIAPHVCLILEVWWCIEREGWAVIHPIWVLCNVGPRTVFKINAGLRPLTGKIWVVPASFPSLSYINFGKIVLRSSKFQIIFWRLLEELLSPIITWLRSGRGWSHHNMELFAALLVLCEENPLGTHQKGLVMQSFGIFFAVSLNMLLKKPPSNWWFQRPWHKQLKAWRAVEAWKFSFKILFYMLLSIWNSH